MATRVNGSISFSLHFSIPIRGSARSYRAGLAVTEAAGDGTYHRGNEDHASGRCRRRSVRETDPGRGCLPGRAICAASHRRSSVNRKGGSVDPSFVKENGDQIHRIVQQKYSGIGCSFDYSDSTANNALSRAEGNWSAKGSSESTCASVIWLFCSMIMRMSMC